MSYKYTSHTQQAKTAIDAAISRALQVIGDKASDYAADLAPFDTGRLAGSISPAMVGEKTVAIGTNVEYAPYQELGTVKMRAHPYLRPGVEGHQAEWKHILENELSKIG